MSGEIIRLNLRAPLTRDCAPAEMCGDPQGIAALQTLGQAMARCYQRQDFRGFDTGLRRLMRLAPAMGLAALAWVAADVCHCLYRRDGTALAATWSRLLRLLEQVCGPGD